MEPRVATGILLYRLQRTPEFLLIHDSYSHRRHWTPPKGYLIGKEGDLKCALRSTTELTGLQAKDIIIEDGYSFQIRYLSDSKPKQITYFLAQISDYGKIGCNEGTTFGWFSPEQASEKVMYRSMQDVISKAKDAVIDIVKSKLAQLANNPTAVASSSSEVSQRRNIGALPNEKSLAGPTPLSRPQPLQPRRQQGSGYNPNPNNNNNTSNTSNTNRNYNNNYDYNHDDNDDDFEERNYSRGNSISARRSDNAASPSSASHNPLYKTKLCERYEKEGSCPYESKCVFAHGMGELKEKAASRTPPNSTGQGSGSLNANPLHKTKLCARFMAEGSCPYDTKCVFAHGEGELRPLPAQVREPGGSFGQGGSFQRDHSPASLNGGNGRTYSNPGMQRPTGYSSGNTSSMNGAVATSTKQNPAPSGSMGSPRNEGFHSGREQLRSDDRSSSEMRRSQPQRSQRRMGDRQFPKNGDSEKSWMKVVDYTDAEKEMFRVESEVKVENLGKKLDKMRLEDQVVKELKDFFSTPHSLDEEVKEVNRKDIKHEFTAYQLLVILLLAIMEGGDYAGKLKNRVAFFKNFVNTDDRQLAFLKAWENFISRTPGSESQVLHVMKCLYETDLVEEDTFMQWHQLGNNSNSAFHQKGIPFIKWLQMTDAESE